MWEQGNQPINKEEVIKVNDELMKLEGYLTDKEAAMNLVKFLKSNIGFTTKTIAGVDLFPFQEIAIKTMFKRDYFLGVWGRGLSKCINSEDYIWTDSGLKKAKNIEVGDFVQSEKEFNLVTNKTINPPQKTYKVVSENGYESEGLDYHRVLCCDKGLKKHWSFAKDLKRGDLLVMRKNCEHPLKTKYKFPLKHFGLKKQNFDNKELFYFLGVFIISGGIYEKSARIETRAFETKNICCSFLNKIGVDYTLEGDGERPAVIRIKDERLILCLKKAGLEENPNNNSFGQNRISEKLLSSSKDDIKYLLRGIYDSAGTVSLYGNLTDNVTPLKINLEYNKSELIKQISNLLLQFGIISSTTKCDTIVNLDIISQNSLYIFKKLIGSSVYKKDRFLALVKDKKLIEQNIFYDKVDRVECGFAETVDITVAKEENYVSNGFINHNSYSTGVFAFLLAIFQPGTKIAIISSVFRQSKQIFKYVEDIAIQQKAQLLAECINGQIKHANDEWSMQIGSSEIKALPLGDSGKLRGFRFNCLLIDEFLLIPERTLNEVLLPFIATNSEPDKRQKIYDEESSLIKQGLMLEDERTKFPNPKVIGLSSASYTFEHLYKVYSEYIKKIRLGTEKNEFGETVPLKGSYAVMQASHMLAPSQFYSESAINKARSEMSEAQFNREYKAIFTDDSSAFYSAKAMEACTVPYQEYPVLEIKGKSDSKYLLAIDPSWAENESSDFFAMILFKILPNGRYMQCHSYAVAGGKLKEHLNYFHYLVTNFNVEFIMMDNAGGVQFLNSINESKKFTDAGISFSEINCSFDNVQDYQGQLRIARNQYNTATRKIVYMQYFNSDWLMRANHLLQANINNRKIVFAGDPQNITDEFDNMRQTKIPIDSLEFMGKNDMNSDSEECKVEEFDTDKGLSDVMKNDSKMIDLIERQAFLLRLTKTQCALIEPKSTDGGHMSFTLPHGLKNQKGANKTRKDLYTALLLGTWGVKCYNDMLTIQEEQQEEWVPIKF